jgi:hypothetical protein
VTSSREHTRPDACRHLTVRATRHRRSEESRRSCASLVGSSSRAGDCHTRARVRAGGAGVELSGEPTSPSAYGASVHRPHGGDWLLFATALSRRSRIGVAVGSAAPIAGRACGSFESCFLRPHDGWIAYGPQAFDAWAAKGQRKITAESGRPSSRRRPDDPRGDSRVAMQRGDRRGRKRSRETREGCVIRTTGFDVRREAGTCEPRRERPASRAP